MHEEIRATFVAHLPDCDAGSELTFTRDESTPPLDLPSVTWRFEVATWPDGGKTVREVTDESALPEEETTDG